MKWTVPMRIEVNPDAEIQRQQIDARHICIVIDQFLSKPQAVLEFAARHQVEFSRPSRFIPAW